MPFGFPTTAVLSTSATYEVTLDPTAMINGTLRGGPKSKDFWAVHRIRHLRCAGRCTPACRVTLADIPVSTGAANPKPEVLYVAAPVCRTNWVSGGQLVVSQFP